MLTESLFALTFKRLELTKYAKEKNSESSSFRKLIRMLGLKNKIKRSIVQIAGLLRLPVQ